MSDEEIVQRVREALNDGAVTEAQQWASGIQDFKLRQEMLALIQDYED